MSQQDQQDVKDNPALSIFRSSRNEPERALVAKPLITNDKDLWTKTRIVNVFTMTMIDTVAKWGKIEQAPPYDCVNKWCDEKFYDPEEYIEHAWEEIYRINAISGGNGMSREEFVKVTMTPAAIGVMQEADSKRMKEGARG